MLMSSILGESLIDEFFDDFARPAKRVAKYSHPDTAVMRTDVKEGETGYELDVELPGYRKDDVKLELKEGNLIISATRTAETEDKAENGKYIHKERFYGNCRRSFYVGDVLEQTDIKAKFEDGILKVFVPKKEVKPAIEEGKYIEIEG